MSDAARVAHKFASEIINNLSRNGWTHGHEDFRSHYANLEDHEKLAVVKELHGRGVINPVLARKKKPPLGGEVVDSVHRTSKNLIDEHKQHPLNRHVPFTDSEHYKRITKEP